MPSFGKRSREKLDTCDERLQKLFEQVVKDFDCSILEGHRSQQRQDQLFRENKSQVKWPNGKHNTTPSMAVDVAPYPVDWKDINQFYHFAGYVRGVARMMDIELRFGGDWDGDYEVADETFKDLPHFELRDPQA